MLLKRDYLSDYAIQSLEERPTLTHGLIYSK
jgi:hypothetical protein